MIRADSRWRLGRGTWLGVAAVLLFGAVLAARPAAAGAADPALDAARQRALVDRASAAATALAVLEAELGPAREAARAGASLLVEGERPPQPRLEDAAGLLAASAPEADAVADSLVRLRGTAASVSPGLDVPQVRGATELLQIGGQLLDAAEAAERFFERRMAAERKLARLDAALAALRAEDLEAADRALDDARRARATLATWEPRPVTLPLWLRTTRRLITAADDIAEAAGAGDQTAARIAARRYAAAADEARRADVSLALTLSEAGSGLTAIPLRRLADELAAMEDARAFVQPLLQ